MNSRRKKFFCLLSIFCILAITYSKNNYASQPYKLDLNGSSIELWRIGAQSSFNDLGKGMFQVTISVPKKLKKLAKYAQFKMINLNGTSIIGDINIDDTTRCKCKKDYDICTCSIRSNFADYNSSIINYKSYRIDFDNFASNTELAPFEESVPEFTARLSDPNPNSATKIITLKNICQQPLEILEIKNNTPDKLNIFASTSKQPFLAHDEYEIRIEPISNELKEQNNLSFEIKYRIRGQTTDNVCGIFFKLKYEDITIPPGNFSTLASTEGGYTLTQVGEVVAATGAIIWVIKKLIERCTAGKTPTLHDKKTDRSKPDTKPQKKKRPDSKLTKRHSSQTSKRELPSVQDCTITSSSSVVSCTSSCSLGYMLNTDGAVEVNTTPVPITTNADTVLRDLDMSNLNPNSSSSSSATTSYSSSTESESKLEDIDLEEEDDDSDEDDTFNRTVQVSKSRCSWLGCFRRNKAE